MGFSFFFLNVVYSLKNSYSLHKGIIIHMRIAIPRNKSLQNKGIAISFQRPIPRTKRAFSLSQFSLQQLTSKRQLFSIKSQIKFSFNHF